MRSFTSYREDLQIAESYEDFKYGTMTEKQVTLNDHLKKWKREKREAELKEDLLVLWAIIQAFFYVSLIFLSVLVGSYLAVYGW